jgi:DNA-binding transcriptional LysR family regulator
MTRPSLDDWAAFVAVAETRSFAAAARALGWSKATVSRAVAGLEAHFGAALLHRHARHVALTPLGAEALGQARLLLEQADAIDAALREAGGAPSGLVRLAAPLAFGEAHLAPLLPAFLSSHPGIRLELHLDDARTDLVAGGFDLALRIGALADSTLVARRLCDVPRHLVAAPAYLAAAGSPAHPRALADHACLLYRNLPTPGVWRFTHAREGAVTIPVSGPLAANSGGALLPALHAGLGIALEPAFLLGTAIQDGRLVSLLPDWAPPPIALWLIAPPGRRPARVRLLADYLVATLARPEGSSSESGDKPL